MQTRLNILVAYFIIAAVLVWGRLFYWQVIHAADLENQGQEQTTAEYRLPAQRGKILTSDGFELVTNASSFFLYANPQKITDPPTQIAESLAEILPFDLPYSPQMATAGAEVNNAATELLKDKFKATVVSRLQRRDKSWVPIRNRVNSQTKQAIEQANIPGLGFEEGTARYYPEASTAAHLVGFTGVDNSGLDQGYFGLEGYYDLELKGRPGYIAQEVDAFGQPIPLGDLSSSAAVPGSNLHINIDRSVQFVTETRLAEALKKYQAKSGVVIILEPETGKVLAMASAPAYNPGKYNLYPTENYRNPAISESFEPGSIFKVLAMAASLDAGAVKPETKCDNCGAPVVIGSNTIRTWNNVYTANITMTDTIIHSDNTGMVYAVKQLGQTKFLDYLDKLGLSAPTGIDLADEQIVPLRPAKEWKEIDLATASFGQGIALTPIQIITAATTITHHGQRLTPYVVNTIEGPQKTSRITPPRPRKVFSQKTAQEITEMMRLAVDKGEAKWAKPAHYALAGKTGTAQIPIAGHYDAEKTIASFLGFAPVDHPRFLMLVTLREPKTSPWGSETAAPLFFQIAEDIFRLWNIPPDQ